MDISDGYGEQYTAESRAGRRRTRERAAATRTGSGRENPQSVLKAIDQYAQRSWLMNIGEDKGLILD